MMIYNFMFTAAPPLAMGAYEKRLHENILSKTPKLYRYVSQPCLTTFVSSIIFKFLHTGSTRQRLSQSVLAGYVRLALAKSCDLLCGCQSI